jgi:15-cis-phytoene synthase
MLMSLRDDAGACAADVAACRKMLRGGSRTFFAASLLLPPHVRAPASALYAFCRQADDAIDLDGGREAAIARLCERLDRAYDGRPLPLPTDRAFADTVARFAIPRALPEAMLEGLAWDAAGRRYETLADLRGYAARVAGTVGAMMALLIGGRAPEILARACDLGIAMQLSNIARDVGEDARDGRLYLPLEWLQDAGIEPDAWLARPVFSDALGSIVGRLLGAAEVLYVQADAGIDRLPAVCRPGIRAARLLYAEIGREVERLGFDSVSRRAVVPSRRRARLVARALFALPASQSRATAPALAEARFLVEAVAAAPLPSLETVAARIPLWNFVERVNWVIDLFERLERREQAEGSARGL